MKISNDKAEIKMIIEKSGYNITKLNDKLNKKNGTNFSKQNLYNKINGDKANNFTPQLKYSDILQIADILDYDIEWVKRDTNSSNIK
jgi:hypothetical protein